MYHFVLPAKYRRAVFSDSVDQTLKDVCLQIALRYNIVFLEIGTDKNYVHFLIQSVPTYSPTKIVTLIKSITARNIFRLIDKVNSEGTRAWIKSGQIPTTDILQEIDALAENFNERQKSQYRILKAIWNPILGLTVDRDIILVYIHSVMTLYGITLREWLLDDDFLILLNLVETRFASSRKEFGEKATKQLIDLLITITLVQNKVDFKKSTIELFATGYEITNSRKYDLVELFCYYRIIGGSKNEQTI